MATLLSSSSLQSIRLSSFTLSTSHSLPFCTFHRHSRISPFKALSINKNRTLLVAKAVEDETQQQEQLVTESEEQQQPTSTSEQQPVVVPISPSDTLTMLFQVQHH